MDYLHRVCYETMDYKCKKYLMSHIAEIAEIADVGLEF